MGEVNRTVVALLAACAALFAWPAAATAAPPTCEGPFTLTVVGDAPATYDAACPDATAYAVVTQPTKGSVTNTDARFTYTPEAGEASKDSFTFTASNVEGDSPTYTVTIQRDPTVRLTASPSTATTGEAITFTATGSDPDGGAVTYAWSDPEPDDIGPTITRSFPTAGDYTVTVTVTDDEGETGAVSTSVQVSAPPNQPPSVDLDASSTRPLPGQPVTFIARATDPDEGGLTYAWTVDGVPAAGETEASITRSFATAGTHTVTVRVTDDDGAATDAESVVQVAAAPPPPASSPPPAAPPPASPPPPPPIARAADTTAPAFGISRPAGQRLKGVRRRGLRFAVRCDEPCSVYLELLVSRKTARRLKIDRRARGPVRVGRVTATAGPTRRTVKIKLTRKASRRLERARRVTMTLQGSAFDAGGYTTLLKPRRIAVRR